MNRKAGLQGLARAGLLAVTAVSSVYCALCSLDFAWTNFIKDRRFPDWFAFFLEHHAALAFLALALACALLKGRRRTAWCALAAAFWVAAIRPGLAALGPGLAANALAGLVWTPYLAWELLQKAPGLELPEEGLAMAGLAGGLWVAVAYALHAGRAGISPAALVWSLVIHGALGCGLGLLFEAVGSARPKLAFALAAALGAALFYVIALRSLSFPVPQALGYAVL
jgi:hypothetical protein